MFIEYACMHACMLEYVISFEVLLSFGHMIKLHVRSSSVSYWMYLQHLIYYLMELSDVCCLWKAFCAINIINKYFM